MIKHTVLALALLALLPGCQSFSMETPADFMELDEADWSEYSLRATSAEGVVLAVREVDNEQEGTLAFWAKALKERLRQGRGYALTGEESVNAASGETGTQLRFGHDEAKEAYTYWVTLFVTEGSAFAPSRLVVVETGGKRELFDAAAGRIGQALESLEIY